MKIYARAATLIWFPAIQAYHCLPERSYLTFDQTNSAHSNLLLRIIKSQYLSSVNTLIAIGISLPRIKVMKSSSSRLVNILLIISPNIEYTFSQNVLSFSLVVLSTQSLNKCLRMFRVIPPHLGQSTSFSVSELSFTTKEHSSREPVFLTGICQSIDGFNLDGIDRKRRKSSFWFNLLFQDSSSNCHTAVLHILFHEYFDGKIPDE